MIAVEVKTKINYLSSFDVNKVTPYVVKKAASDLKDSKSDPTFSFNSDCIKNGTDQLFEKLSLSLKSFLTHGHITYFLLLVTLLSIIKDKLALMSARTTEALRSAVWSSSYLTGSSSSCMVMSFVLMNFNLPISRAVPLQSVLGLLWRQSITF